MSTRAKCPHCGKQVHKRRKKGYSYETFAFDLVGKYWSESARSGGLALRNAYAPHVCVKPCTTGESCT